MYYVYILSLEMMDAVRHQTAGGTLHGICLSCADNTSSVIMTVCLCSQPVDRFGQRNVRSIVGT